MRAVIGDAFQALRTTKAVARPVARLSRHSLGVPAEHALGGGRSRANLFRTEAVY